MSPLEPTTSLAELVAERPSRARLFESLRLDYCCGGAQSLAAACAERDLDPATVGRLLAAADDAAPAEPAAVDPAEDRDWRQAGIDELCAHIVAAHHQRLREELPRVGELAATVSRVHGPEHPELVMVGRAFAVLRAELGPHLDEEERELFPACEALERDGKAPAGFDLAAVDRHQAEHEAVGKKLAALRELAGGYEEEQALCSTHRALLVGLAAFEADLHRHVHEENNVLFPRVRELAADASPPLFDILLDALAALGEAGEPAAANRLAAGAYASLRRHDPERAQRVNVLMHRLVSREKKNERSESCPPTPISTSAASPRPAATS